MWRPMQIGRLFSHSLLTMITLFIRISGHGPVHFKFSSATVASVRLHPAHDGSLVGLSVGNLGSSSVSFASTDGSQGAVMVDVNEGPDPLWLAFTIDCTQGGSVSVGFGGSPTVRVNSGSFLGLEYDNGQSASLAHHNHS